jgi:hypothetical protein
MRSFSRVAFICNIGFLVFVLLAYIELNEKREHAGGGLVQLPFLTGTLVILGQLAIFVNLAFCVFVLVILLLKKMNPAAQWLVITNFIFLLIQVYYFFI